MLTMSAIYWKDQLLWNIDGNPVSTAIDVKKHMSEIKLCPLMEYKIVEIQTAEESYL